MPGGQKLEFNEHFDGQDFLNFEKFDECRFEVLKNYLFKERFLF